MIPAIPATEELMARLLAAPLEAEVVELDEEGLATKPVDPEFPEPEAAAVAVAVAAPLCGVAAAVPVGR